MYNIYLTWISCTFLTNISAHNVNMGATKQIAKSCMFVRFRFLAIHRIPIINHRSAFWISYWPVLVQSINLAFDALTFWIYLNLPCDSYNDISHVYGIATWYSNTDDCIVSSDPTQQHASNLMSYQINLSTAH